MTVKNFERVAFASLCAGIFVLAGCKTQYSECGFASSGEGAGAILGAPEENPMPAALSPEAAGDVIYPEARPPKAKEYWEEHPDPYEGMIAPKAKAPELPAPSDSVKYVVKKGDTLGAIANRNGFSLRSVKALNGGINYDRLLPGQVIYLPAKAGAKVSARAESRAAGGVHIVKNGEILGRIARNYGVRVSDIRAANGLSSDKILVGQKLVIPAKGAAKPAPAKKAEKPKPPAAKPIEKPVEAPIAPAVSKPAAAPAAPPAGSIAEMPALPEMPPLPAPPAAVEEPSPVAPSLPPPAGSFDAEIPVPSADLIPTSSVQEAAPPEEPKTLDHIVRDGEDFFSIAIKWSVGVKEIQAANAGLSLPLKPGTVVKVPVKTAKAAPALNP